MVAVAAEVVEEDEEKLPDTGVETTTLLVWGVGLLRLAVALALVMGRRASARRRRDGSA